VHHVDHRQCVASLLSFLSHSLTLSSPQTPDRSASFVFSLISPRPSLIETDLSSHRPSQANSRIYVESAVYDQFTAKMKEAMMHFKHGDPMQQDTTLGCVLIPFPFLPSYKLTLSFANSPQADKIQGERVEEYLKIGKTEGKVLVGGERCGKKVRSLLVCSPFYLELTSSFLRRATSSAHSLHRRR
jgi:hypothetical protein